VLDVRVGAGRSTPSALALPVGTQAGARVLLTEPPAGAAEDVGRFLADIEHTGGAGSVHILPRPGRSPGHVVLVGVGGADEAGWRAAGAALARVGIHGVTSLTLNGVPADQAGALAEGAWLASYRYRLGRPVEGRPQIRRLVVAATDAPAAQAALDRANAITQAVVLARDLTNTPSLNKTPAWFADRIVAAAGRRAYVTATVRGPAELAREGFGGILAVGSGSARPPRLLELSWRPRRAQGHVVLVGKGITFDSGGYSLKPLDGMKLMRKDMAGAAAVCGTVLAAADLEIPVRVTALAPLAENMVSGSAWRPGDVVRHYGGLTSEIGNTDAEGRVVLSDALAYAAKRLRPDVLVDLATLTGAARVALGKKIAALFSHDEELVAALTRAGEEVGEPMWRMPLADDYTALLASDVADLNNAPAAGQAGAVTAALYLREFTGDLRPHWAHIDMSAPSWSDSAEAHLAKGATGWGVRTLIRWLEALASGP
jgi:leucyl aminopeptidase